MHDIAEVKGLPVAQKFYTIGTSAGSTRLMLNGTEHKQDKQATSMCIGTHAGEYIFHKSN